MNIIKLSLLSFGILFGSVVFAQEKKQLSEQKVSKEQHMEKRADNFSQELNLTATQREKITEIRRNTNEKRVELKKNQSLDNSNMGLAMKELRYKEKEDISKILTPEQLVKFEGMKNNRNVNYEKRKNNHQVNNNHNKKFKGEIKADKMQHKSKKGRKQLAPAKE